MNNPRPRWPLITVCMLLALVIATVLDPWVEHWGNHHGHLRYDSDLLRLFRVAGFVPAWLGIAACLALTDRRARVREWWGRATLLTVSVLGTALIAEAVKLVVRRERPHAALEHGVFYSFRSWLDAPLSSSGVGFPSSHAAVAFGGAFMLVRLVPATWPVILLWSCGCAATRVLAGAHYVSDTVAAAVIGYALSTWLFATTMRRQVRTGALLQT